MTPPPATMDRYVWTLAAAVVLALVHFLAGYLRFLEGIPRSRWLSMAGGVSVAYVFLHLLPELAEGGAALEAAGSGLLAGLERDVYLVALAGIVVFYGLERAARQSRRTRRAAGEKDATEPGIFWLHVASFSLYNALIGYLLVHRDEEEGRLFFFTLALLLHFVVTDYGLREDHKAPYTRVGRWVLAAAILVGWTLGVVLVLPEVVTVVVTAFLAGGIVLNVLKEELPEERESRYSAFLLGAVGYAALLLAV